MTGWILLAHAGATLFMTGLVWFVQLVHYPLFGRVGDVGYDGYHREHVRRTTWLVVPMMAVEGATAVLLAWRPPPGAPAWLPWVGLALAVVVWVSTALLQLPRHGRLRGGFAADAHAALVAGNWVRTVLWTARSILALGMIGCSLR